MANSELDLLKTRRFFPLFVTQFLGAANDNFFKNALVMLIAFRLAEQASINGQILITVAADIFILPFFLFSATAGQFADKFEKSGLFRTIKFAEIGIMGLGALGLILGNAYFLIVVLFLMGAQSSFFGPIKYGILPTHLRQDELVGGNGLIEAGTFLAILIGTIAGGLLILTSGGTAIVSVTIVVLAVAGWVASRSIPRAEPPAPHLPINYNFVSETYRLIQLVRSSRVVFLTILGISWFWLVGATFLAQFPNLVKDNLGANQEVFTLFLTTFSVGIAIGSLTINKLLKGEVTAKTVPLSAIGLTIFILDFYFATNRSAPVGGELIGVASFLSQSGSWRILFDLLAIAVCGGTYVVPLFALLQSRSDEEQRGRTIAANNIVGAAFMFISAVGSVILLNLGFSVPDIFLTVALLNAVVAIYICGLLPDALIKAMLVSLFKLVYRVEIKGVEHYRNAGDKAVVIVNHVSFVDGLLLAAFLPDKPTFAINTFIARQWWVKPFLNLIDAFPIDPTNPMATKALIKAVKEGRKCVIFPEGRITVTGALMKIYEGPGLVADKSEAQVMPIRIDGAQFTPFSRLRGKLRIRWFPKVTITILEPRKFDMPDDVFGRARRQVAGNRLYDVMSDLIFETCDYQQTLFDSLVDARDVHGSRHVILEDIERKPMSYKRLIQGAIILGGEISQITSAQEKVGVMLPNSVGVVVTFFSLQAYGRVPAMLNFSTGLRNMKLACEVAEIGTILTSRRFIELARLEPTVEELEKSARIVYLEDLRDGLTPLKKLWGLIKSKAPRLVHRRNEVQPNDPAVVLFASGSEGAPKGVVLSHANLLANRYQLASRVDFNPTDTVFNALPVFHSFGLTGGTLLPVFTGIKAFMYPSPLHYRIVPALVYDCNATIMFGTDTFLSGYARVAHPYDFYSVRYIFAGAEKVKDETRLTWAEKFGIRILEGYGATETSPALSTNTPMHFKAGTVGRLLPGIDYKLEPMPGIEEGGRLIVRGPNIMLGYLKADRPGTLQPPAGGWYDTGDIVTVDEHGYVKIQGRAKRFAKIAGEMVSLSAVEGFVNELWQGATHAVVSVPDAKKGEKLILVTDHTGADRSDLQHYAKGNGIAEIMLPREIRQVDKVPVLATGKTDYVRVSELAVIS